MSDAGRLSGWGIFRAALGLLIGNLRAAARVSLVPFGLVGLLLAAVIASVGEWNVAFGLPGPQTAPSPTVTGEQAASWIVLAAASLTAICWVAVAWHRRILMHEDAGIVPPFRGAAVWGYAWRSAVVVLILIVAGLVVAIPASLFGVFAGQAVGGVGGAIAGAMLGSFVANAILGALFYSIGLVLPARAVDRPIGFGESMAAARGSFGALVILAILTALLTLLLELPGTLDVFLGSDLGSWVGFAIGLLVQWFVFMLGLSILTTLYAKLVEGRAA